METKIAVFKGQKVRKTIHNNEWWFSVIDVVEALTGSSNPRDYWYKMKIREKDTSEVELSTICRQLKLTSSDDKCYETDCANTEGVFRIIQSIPSPKAEPFKRWLARVGYERIRIIQSIPSPKAEPFKRWLARVGYERIKEIEDPELATKRTRALYKLKGYSDN
ncbi:MAG: Bro-N domain-containing protein, partial [Candidatus Omnitrophica bacterium]|nr:Bro-N domain-containing protein [Candidatus Omnitrophota bacterium]